MNIGLTNQKQESEQQDPIAPDKSFASVLDESGYNASDDLQGAIVSAIVVDKNDKWVVVDAGFKSESCISKSEFSKQEFTNLNIGDAIETYVVSANNSTGTSVLSYEKRVKDQVWQQLEAYHKDRRIIEGKIISKVKKGFMVDIGSVMAFLPFVNMESRLTTDANQLIGSIQQFQVIKIDNNRGSVILSKKSIFDINKLDKPTDENMMHVLNIKEGDTIKGVVKSIANYGAFVDIGNNVGGLLHVSDISWSRIQCPSTHIEVGDNIDVKILKIDSKNNRISLGMKQLTENPWHSQIAKYEPNTKVSGTVALIADYGAFVEIEPGIEGLIHVSEFKWGERHAKVSDYVNERDKIEVMILGIEKNKHRMRLSLKHTQPNPASEFIEANPIGTKVECKVITVTDFGLSVLIEGSDVKGFINAYELQDQKANKKVILAKFSKKDVLTAVVIGYSVDNATVALSTKRLIPDALSSFTKKEGSTVKCTVKEFTEYGLGVEMEEFPDVNAFIKMQDLSIDKNERRIDSFKIGTTLEAIVYLIDRKSKKVYLSIRALQQKETAEALEKYNSHAGGENLGSLFAHAGIATSDTKEIKDDS